MGCPCRGRKHSAGCAGSNPHAAFTPSGLVIEMHYMQNVSALSVSLSFPSPGSAASSAPRTRLLLLLRGPTASRPWPTTNRPATDSPAPAATPARPPDTSLKHIPGQHPGVHARAHPRLLGRRRLVSRRSSADAEPSSCTAASRTCAAARCATCPTARAGRRTRRRRPAVRLHRAAADGLQERPARERRPAQDEHGADDRSRDRHDRRRDQSRPRRISRR